MLQKLLFGIAFFTHPIFIPFYFFLLYGSSEADELAMFFFVSVIIPSVVFWRRKINFNSPNIQERRFIYLVLGLIYLLIVVLCEMGLALHGLEMKALFPMIIAMLILFLTSYKMKVSWHSTVWGVAVFLSLGLVFDTSHYMETKEFEFLPLYFTAGIGILVMLVRYIQRAHTIIELLSGFILGLIIPYLTYFVLNSWILPA